MGKKEKKEKRSKELEMYLILRQESSLYDCGVNNCINTVKSKEHVDGFNSRTRGFR